MRVTSSENCTAHLDRKVLFYTPPLSHLIHQAVIKQNRMKLNPSQSIHLNISPPSCPQTPSKIHKTQDIHLTKLSHSPVRAAAGEAFGPSPWQKESHRSPKEEPSHARPTHDFYPLFQPQKTPPWTRLMSGGPQRLYSPC